MPTSPSSQPNVAVTETARSRRDAALDTMRGWFIVVMCTSHIGTYTVSNKLTHFLRFFNSASGFVLLSGIVIGMVYGPDRGIGAVKRATQKLIPRAAMLWGLQVVLVMATVAYQGATLATDFIRSPSELGGWASTISQVTLLRYQPAFLNVLPMYVIFLAICPLVLWMLHRSMLRWIIAISVSIYAVAQFSPTFLAVTDPKFGPESFRLPAWQLIFVMGICLGFHRSWLRNLYTNRAVIRRIMIACAIYFTCVFVLAQVQRNQLQPFHLLSDAQVERLFDRQEERPLRLLYIISAMALIYPLLRLMIRNRILPGVTGALQRMGQHSLYCFVVQTIVALAFNAVDITHWHLALQELATIGAIIGVYGSTFLIPRAKRPVSRHRSASLAPAVNSMATAE